MKKISKLLYVLCFLGLIIGCSNSSASTSGDSTNTNDVSDFVKDDYNTEASCLPLHRGALRSGPGSSCICRRGRGSCYQGGILRKRDLSGRCRRRKSQDGIRL